LLLNSAKELKDFIMILGGISILCDDTDIETVIKYADQALYTSKVNGKNQVTFYKQ
jgi:PleD family two-component response regulator